MGLVMNEAHFGEIEKVLLYVSEARERAARARRELSKTGAEPHLIAALQAIEAALSAEHRRLMQSTFYAVAGQEQLAV
jgi:hypothetical protein